ncbi:MAG: formylglycine-generating enzyme family protein, partial [Verrucomicrobiota bacterium]
MFADCEDLGGIQGNRAPRVGFVFLGAGWPIEFPQHKVRISRAFYLGDTEVTQGQWKAIMGSNPSDFKGDDLPVEHVTWRACVTFAQKLSEKEGKKYRLPTEAEWEYACRAGSTTAYYFGDDPALLGEYEWFAANSQGKTHPVG